MTTRDWLALDPALAVTVRTHRPRPARRQRPSLGLPLDREVLLMATQRHSAAFRGRAYIARSAAMARIQAILEADNAVFFLKATAAQRDLYIASLGRIGRTLLEEKRL